MTRKLLIGVVLILTATVSNGQIPSGYYSAATGTGYTLKSQLHDIIDDHTSVSYSSLWGYYDDTDLDSDGYIFDMYSENPSGTDPYNYTYSSDQCGNYSGEGSCYNREHSFPKSWFSDASPMYTDIHHVVPTDGYVNGRRSNYPYGEVASATWTSQNGSKVGSSAISGYSGTVFEPIDEYKGDFARIYFYMATRYEDVITGWSSDMLDGSSDQVYEDWALDMLMDWHDNDPVSQKEIDRNDEIYDLVQGNRNPFVDHPEYVNAIWGDCSGTPTIQVTNFTTSAISDTSIDLSLTPGDGDKRLVVMNTEEITFSPSNSSSYTANSDFSSASDQGDGNKIVYAGSATTFTITGLSSETIYTAKVFEFCSADLSYIATDAPIHAFKTSGPSTTLVSEDFSSCGSIVFSSQDEGGTGTWGCTSGLISMNGYSDGNSEDWLISDAINFDLYDKVTLSFDSRARYSGGNDVQVYYSTTYSGSGSPTGFTEISTSDYNIAIPGSGSSYGSWEYSGEIDLSSVSGTSVYIGFKYTADGSASGSEDWQLDDIEIVGVDSEDITDWSGSWDSGAPDSTMNASISDNFRFTENTPFQVKDLTVNSGDTLVVDSVTLVVMGDLINNGHIVINSGGGLVTFSSNTIAGYPLVFKRNLRFGDGEGKVTMLGIPVQQSSELTGSDLTNGNYLYEYDESVSYEEGGTDGLNRWVSAVNDELVPGVGYAQSFKGNITLTGMPNSGTISVSELSHTVAAATTASNRGWNLIANPYPSAISVSEFLSENTNVDGSIAIWDDGGSNNGRRPNSDYLVANTLGAAGPNGGEFIGSIGAMQGFFVRVTNETANTSIDFTEDMREFGRNADSSFFRSEPVSTIRLNIEELTTSLSNSALLAITEEATSGFDRYMDSEWFSPNLNNPRISTNLNELKLAIQAVPFNHQQVVLSLDIPTDGEYLLSFSTDEQVAEYVFVDLDRSLTFALDQVIQINLQAGEYSDRFVLERIENNLANEDFFYKIADGNLVLNSTDIITGIAVYDMNGRIISKESSMSNKLTYKLPDNPGIYLYRITMTDESRVIKLLVE